MFERLDPSDEAYSSKLSSALRMERSVLEILEANIEHAHDQRVNNVLEGHLEESIQHLDNIQEAFELLGWDIEDSPCPAIEGLEREGEEEIKASDDSARDEIILQGCAKVERHEIGVYENLIRGAGRMGRDDVVTVLRRNIASEQSALENVRSLATELALPVAVQSG